MANYRGNSRVGLREIGSLILLCLSALVIVGLYLPAEFSGAMGAFTVTAARGLFGSLYHILPLSFIAVSVINFFPKKVSLTKALLLHAFIFVVLSAALYQHFTLSHVNFIQQVEQLTQYLRHTMGDKLFLDNSLVRVTTSLNLLWQAGVNPEAYPLLNGVAPAGLVGGFFALAFYELFGSVAAKIVLTVLLLGELRILFGFSIFYWLGEIKDAALKSHNNIKEAFRETMQLARERQLERAAIEERELLALQAAYEGAYASDDSAEFGDVPADADEQFEKLTYAAYEDVLADEASYTSESRQELEPVNYVSAMNTADNTSVAVANVPTFSTGFTFTNKAEIHNFQDLSVPAPVERLRHEVSSEVDELTRKTAMKEQTSEQGMHGDDSEFIKPSQAFEPHLIDIASWQQKERALNDSMASAQFRTAAAIKDDNFGLIRKHDGIGIADEAGAASNFVKGREGKGDNLRFNGIDGGADYISNNFNTDEPGPWRSPLNFVTNEEPDILNQLRDNKLLNNRHANAAETAALAREYQVLSTSSLQPQYSQVVNNDVSPFQLDDSSKEYNFNAFDIVAAKEATIPDFVSPVSSLSEYRLPSVNSTQAATSANSELALEFEEVAGVAEAARTFGVRAAVEGSGEPAGMQLASSLASIDKNNAGTVNAGVLTETETSSIRTEAEVTPWQTQAVFKEAAADISAKNSDSKRAFEVVADLDLAQKHDKDKPQALKTAAQVNTCSENSDKDNSLLKACLQKERTEAEYLRSQKPPYIYPTTALLTEVPRPNNSASEGVIRELANKLEFTLKSFGVDAEVINITTGPTITRFELSPGVGVKVSKIVNLADDIALSLAATGVRIEAPIPGKSAIGIEIPNKDKRIVDLRSLLEDASWSENNKALKVALGRDIPGQPLIADLADMTHVLVAGATGSGKSICINSVLISLLYHCHPEDLQLIMVDPKVVELSIYNGIPHLMAPVVTDPKKAAQSLNWACVEMGRRYELLAKAGVRDIKSYNEYVAKQGGFQAARANADGQMVYEVIEKLPYLVIIIDELADLMMTTPQEVEDAINRIAAKGRACGIHLILATQRPSVDVITGVIKANVPSRIAFAVSSQVDSRTILDGSGAEKLLGKGDMLYNPRAAIKPVRAQGAFISDSDVEAVVHFIRENNRAYCKDEDVDIFVDKQKQAADNRDKSEEQDELFNQAVETIIEAGYASVSILQRRLNIGYPRAGRLIDSLEKAGLIGPANGSKPREVRIDAATWYGE